MTRRTYQRDRRTLADRLRTLREEAGFSGNGLAKQLGWVQSRVSKIETAKQLPTPEDVRQWTAAAGASGETVEDLLSLLDRARVEHATWKEHYDAAGGASGKQADILMLEAQATRIVAFQPAMIPGLLQTAEYARDLLHLPCGPATHGADEDEITRMIAVRMQRQQRALYEPGKRIHMIVLEAALRTRVCSPGALHGQLDRLLAIIGLPTLELGIIPFTAQVPVFPLSGFDMYDQDLVVVETVTGETQISDPQEVAEYERLFDLLREAAFYDDDAAGVIRQAIESRAREGSPQSPRRE